MEYYGNKEFTTRKDLFNFLVSNKERLIAQKKAAVKHADCVSISPVLFREKEESAVKSNNPIEVTDAMLTLKVEVVLNTTNIMDRHKDVHVPGIWTKTLQENKMLMHIQEHEMEFEKIISDGDNLKAYTKLVTWMELGFSFEGMTEALIFDSIIDRKRNEFMFLQYANGWVKNHSVGMCYVKMGLAINDSEYVAEFDLWNKWYPTIANKEDADESGYFWVIKEAKLIEGSAVPIGSNYATPTLSNNMKSFEPDDSTQKNMEPQEQHSKGIDYEYLKQNLKFSL